MMRVLAAAIAMLASIGSLWAQELPRRLGGINGPRPAAADTRPIPRLPDGTIDLGGVWSGGGPVDDIAKQGGLPDGEVERLMLPATRKLFETRDPAADPYAYCMPAG